MLLTVTMRADLHSHTTQSDGELSPTVLVKRAEMIGVTHLAITDHDTVAAIAEAAPVAEQLGVHLVAGIEISAKLHGRECHILGHHVTATAALVAWCEDRKLERIDRIRQMVAKLQQNGIRIDLAEVEREAGGTPGRPHIARVLLRAGYVDTMQEAFSRYLNPNTSGWIERPLPDASEAIALVRASGGTTSIAHPGVNKISKAEVGVLAKLGLDAVEARHPDHAPQQAGEFVRWARDWKLAITGGSDFHGPSSVSVELGARVTPEADYNALAKLAESRKLPS